MRLASSNQGHRSLETATLVELLRQRALHCPPSQRAYIFLNEKGIEVESLTYQELDRRAMAIASVLQQQNAGGTPVLLLYQPGLEFIAAFFGCLYAGALAVPVYPPRRNQSAARLHAIRRETQARLALTSTSILLSKANAPAGQTPELENLQWIATDTIGGEQTDKWYDPQVNGETLAFLQYTSGSTTTPKGVMLSHSNILYNQQMIKLAFEHTENSIVLGWLPLYHDMGLIGNVLQPLYVGIPCILMSPISFLLRPHRWLEAITRYRATTSGAPDFAYDLCVRKVTPEQRETLDLSSWDLAFCGAEPIRHQTIERFAETFASCGFRREAFYPCYGLAEATLLVSGGRKAAPPVVHEVEHEVTAHELAPAGTNAHTNTRKIVGCGNSKLDQKIVIVDPETSLECPDGTLGEIWVGGPNVAQGYWNRPLERDETFRAHLQDTGEGPFLRTGDLGFMKNGELFIQGRIKDVIIIRGCNYYPEDIEQTVEQSNEALRPRGGASFAVEANGVENLVIVQEVKRECRNLDVEQVVADIRQAVTETHDIQVYAILLIKAGSIPHTSSGKIQRAKCRTYFLNQSFEIIGSSHAGHNGGNQYQLAPQDTEAIPTSS